MSQTKAFDFRWSKLTLKDNSGHLFVGLSQIIRCTIYHKKKADYRLASYLGWDRLTTRVTFANAPTNVSASVSSNCSKHSRVRSNSSVTVCGEKTL